MDIDLTGLLALLGGCAHIQIPSVVHGGVEAAHRVIETGRTVSEVGRKIGVGEQLLGRWVREERVRTEAATANGTVPLSGAERAELVRLRQQVADQKDDLAFLKKASVYFPALQSKGTTHGLVDH